MGSDLMKKSIHDRVEEIYALYPRKRGRSKGFRVALTQCKSEELLQSLELAIKNYKDHLIKEGTEARYILHFSTFMGQWKDWVCPEEDISLTQGPNLDGIHFD